MNRPPCVSQKCKSPTKNLSENDYYGKDKYCKYCRKYFSTNTRQKKNLAIHTILWDRIELLDYHVDKLIRSNNNLKETLKFLLPQTAYIKYSAVSKQREDLEDSFSTIATPLKLSPLSYIYFYFISRKSWAFFINAFELKYVLIPEIMGRLNYSKRQIQKERLLIRQNPSKLQHDFYSYGHSEDNNTIGFQYIEKNMATIKKHVHLFNRFQRCLKCNKTKQTYYNYLSLFDPVLLPEVNDDNSFIKTLEIKTMQGREKHNLHTPTSVTPYHFARDYKNKLGWKKICRKCKGEDYLYSNNPNTTFGEDVDLRLNTKSENATTILLNDILDGKGLNIWEVESILGKYKKEDKEIKNIDLTAFSSATPKKSEWVEELI